MTVILLVEYRSVQCREQLGSMSFYCCFCFRTQNRVANPVVILWLELISVPTHKSNITVGILELSLKTSNWLNVGRVVLVLVDQLALSSSFCGYGKADNGTS